MEIQIDRKWRLVTTPSGWEVQHRRPLIKGPRKGEVDWASEAQYDTVQWALMGLYRMMLHAGSGRADVLQLAQRVEAVEERIMRAVEEIKNRIGPDLSLPAVEQQATVSPWD